MKINEPHPKSTLIYLHGFNSTPASKKAQQLRHFLENSEHDCLCLIPPLSFSPYQVELHVSAIIEAQLKLGPVSLLGSSLGGYYAIHFAEKYGLYAALINPAVKPYELLDDFLGENVNYYSGERYTLTKTHMSELLALDVCHLSRPERLFLLLQTDDQILNYREALEKLAESTVWVEQGGSHEFDDFEKVIPDILSFLNIT